MGTGGPFSGAKARPGRNADHSAPSSAIVSRSYTSSAPLHLHKYVLQLLLSLFTLIGRFHFRFSDYSFSCISHLSLLHVKRSVSLTPCDMITLHLRVNELKIRGWNAAWWVTSCREMHSSKTCDSSIHYEKITYLTIVLF
jgi:hypothetical protein